MNDYSSFKNQLENIAWHDLDVANWRNKYPYAPQAKFQIAHHNQAIILHYEIKENFVKAQYIRHNEAVWEDSCVEFFVSFDEREHYYNFEFNPLGTGLIGYGPATKNLRNRLTPEEINQVSTYTQLSSIQGDKIWSMILCIPVTVFIHTPLSSLSGLKAHANFYKCGDKLPDPHFLSWNPIDHPSPNFHLPAYFGSVEFK